MKYNIYNLYSPIMLISGEKIYLQRISLSHTYSGLLCGSPNDHINNDILHDIQEQYSNGLFVIEPKINMVSESDFFGRSIPDYDDKIQIPLIPPVKVETLFECYDSEPMTYLNIVWFQDDFSVPNSKDMQLLIQDSDWNQYACEFNI